MRGPYTTPKLDIDITKLLTLQKCTDADQLNADLTHASRSLITDLTNYSEGKTNGDFERLRILFYKINTLLQNNQGIADYFIKNGSKLNTKDPDLSDAWQTCISLLMQPDDVYKVFKLYTDTFIKTGGRPKDSSLSNNKLKSLFVKRLINIYETATGKKAGATAGSSDCDSKFVKFANNVLDLINAQYPKREKGHNILISFNDAVQRSVKSSKN